MTLHHQVWASAPGEGESLLLTTVRQEQPPLWEELHHWTEEEEKRSSWAEDVGEILERKELEKRIPDSVYEAGPILGSLLNPAWD